MKKLLLFLLLGLGTASFAQISGDYRTVSTWASNQWSNTANWETYNGTAWVAATTAPGAGAGFIGDPNPITNPYKTVTIRPNANTATPTMANNTNLNMPGANLVIQTGANLQQGNGTTPRYLTVHDITVQTGASFFVINNTQDPANFHPLQIEGNLVVDETGTTPGSFIGYRTVTATPNDKFATIYSSTATPTGGIFRTRMGVTTYGSFPNPSANVIYPPTYPGATGTLPLNLLSFNANLSLNATQLNWATADEKNTDKFEIEKSLTGNNFIKIGEVKTANTPGNHSYSFLDKEVENGDNYYRLKTVDLDGSFSYSPIKSVKYAGSSLLSIYPNPAASILNLTFPMSKSKGIVRILQVDGKQVLSQNLLENTSNISLNIDNLKAGIYFININSSGNNETIKFVKQ